MSVSFYDFDYIIEINQKRLQEYTVLLHKVSDHITQIILIYSGMGVFLMALIRHLLKADMLNIFFYEAFCAFAGLLLISLFNFVQLLLLSNIRYLKPPIWYYDQLIEKVEEILNTDSENTDMMVKADYIKDLEDAVFEQLDILKAKNAYFKKALSYALLAVIPYSICLMFYLLNK